HAAPHFCGFAAHGQLPLPPPARRGYPPPPRRSNDRPAGGPAVPIASLRPGSLPADPTPGPPCPVADRRRSRPTERAAAHSLPPHTRRCDPLSASLPTP